MAPEQKNSVDCLKITQAPEAFAILRKRNNTRLNELYACIYKLYCNDFLKWILGRFSSRFRDKLLEDAKDAFQNGLCAFNEKAQQEDFSINGTLKTKIYSFGFFQLMASFKKDKSEYGVSGFEACLDSLFQDDLLESETQGLLNEQELHLLDAMAQLPDGQREILHLKFFLKLSSQEIAAKLGISPGHVDNQTSKAYRALRQMLTVNSATNGTDRRTV